MKKILTLFIVAILGFGLLNLPRPNLSKFDQPQDSIDISSLSIPNESEFFWQKFKQQLADTNIVNSFTDSTTSSETFSNSTNIFKPKTPKITKEILSDEDEIHGENIKIIFNPSSTPVNPSQKPITENIVNQNIKPLVGFASSSINPGSTNIEVNQQFTVTFPQAPTTGMVDALQFTPAADFTTSTNGNVVTITPKRLNRLTTYTFGIQSSSVCTTGSSTICSSNQSWLYANSFTTSFKEAYVYGKSAQGRDLVAYFFGTNNNLGKKIMLNGGIHGSEWKSGDLTQLVAYLGNNPAEILGRNKTFILIPFTNPDGTNAGIRYNARGVNLNRNWPDQWEFAPVNNRGSSPLSEPETKSLYDLTVAENPGWIISFHAQWPPNGMIFLGDNDNINTVNFAYWVGDRSKFPVGIYPSPDPGSGGDVGGDQCVWANSININCLIIEATSINLSNYDKHTPMYLALFRDF